MIKVSIIVQLREKTADGRLGRAAIGISEFLAEAAYPLKTWAEKFFDAARRAQQNRTAHLEELARDARPPAAEQISLQLQRPKKQPETVEKKGSHDA